MAHRPTRLLIVPGLHGSGQDHWQSWLQARTPGASRVEQDDWSVPDIGRWSHRIEQTLTSHTDARWIVVAHSFGALSFVHHALHHAVEHIHSAVLVAPADPRKFGCEDALLGGPLPVRTLLVASRNDPWLRFDDARTWARRWGSGFIDLGFAGHVNVESGHGAWPGIERLLQHEHQRLEALALTA